MPTYCGTTGCTGHLGKFADCLTEALYEWSLDGGESDTGNVEFDGHYALIIVPADTTSAVDPNGTPRDVPVPAGNYLVITANSGMVTLDTYDTPEAARAEFDRVDARYALWEAGCDPDNPAAHATCADADECQVTWF